ncbi:MAG: hypothetical protein K1X78_04085 [Verrucomicrobiaceae bacterium]|nr:hypothetical protein [Verrucomicrobiaceae bacterium]
MKTVRLFLSSPGDVGREREATRRVIEGIGLWRCAIVRPSDDSADLFQALAAALLNEGKNFAACESDSVSSRFKEASRLGKKSENLLASLNLLEIKNHDETQHRFPSTPPQPSPS